MSTLTTKRLFSTHDFMRMVETGILAEDDRVELIRGEILTMSPIGTRHAAAVDHANKALVMAAGDQAIVRVQSSVVLDIHDQPQPDLVLLLPREDFYASRHPGPEEILLIIEVSDSSREYDRTVKLQLYAEMGIREYWIADLQDNILFVHSYPDGQSYQKTRKYQRGDSVAPALLPACQVLATVLLAA
jgi:Uma2 family endonuclease